MKTALSHLKMTRTPMLIGALTFFLLTTDCDTTCRSENVTCYIATLRWLRTVSSTFQDVDFDGSLLTLFITWCYNHGIKKPPDYRWTRCYQFCDKIGYHSNTMICWKKPLISALRVYSLKTARWIFFLISNFDRQDKMELLAKFEKILDMGLRATLKPHVGNFFKLCKKLRLIMLIKC